MSPDRREHPLVLIRGADRLRIRVLAETDGEDPPDAHNARRLHQLGLGRLAEAEVGVGIDHRR
jgi:hypothetical protein